MGRSAVNAKKKKKTGRTKTLKSEEKKKSKNTKKVNWQQYTGFYALQDISIFINIQIIINRNVHEYIKYYNADFHSDELLDTDVREVLPF